MAYNKVFIKNLSIKSILSYKKVFLRNTFDGFMWNYQKTSKIREFW